MDWEGLSSFFGSLLPGSMDARMPVYPGKGSYPAPSEVLTGLPDVFEQGRFRALNNPGHMKAFEGVPDIENDFMRLRAQDLDAGYAPSPWGRNWEPKFPYE